LPQNALVGLDVPLVVVMFDQSGLGQHIQHEATARLGLLP